VARRDARIDRVVDALSPLGPVDARAMFGGVGVFVEGAMVGLVADGVLHLKADDSNRAAFARAGLPAFTYQGARGTVRLSFHRAPEPIDDWDVLGPFARGALAAARRARDARARRASHRGPG
jgi:DNA transformation protein and related proteins